MYTVGYETKCEYEIVLSTLDVRLMSRDCRIRFGAANE